MKVDSQIIEICNASEVLDNLYGIPQNSTIFFDVDDTIITPISKVFRREPFKSMIDKLKKGGQEEVNKEIISNWRLQRKVMLVDEQWPEVINQLKLVYPVYALTKMNTGVFGNINSMERWRFLELHELGVDFSLNIEVQNHKLSGYIPQDNDPVFYNGIFMTGSAKKSQVLALYEPLLKTNFMVMVDDRMDYLHDIKEYCDTARVGFLGMLYKGLDNLPWEHSAEVAQFQEAYLMKNARWLEDEIACELYSRVARSDL